MVNNGSSPLSPYKNRKNLQNSYLQLREQSTLSHHCDETGLDTK